MERLSYDAWGKRRYANGADDPAGAITSQSTRGFTEHEQLAAVGLVHMNGRVYDPMLARFASADPVTESPFSTQGWNRYSYVGNSPVNFTDPSGYCFLGCFWKPVFAAIGKAVRSVPLLGAVLQVAAGAICGAPCAALAATVISGVTSGNLGQALKAGLITLVTAGAFNLVGNATAHGELPFGSTTHLANVAGHAAVGCVSAAASGGKCGAGAASAALGSFASPLVGSLGLDGAGKLVATTVLGGLGSVAGGGKFENGAVTGAFGYLFNEMGAQPPKGTSIWPYNDPYVPFAELPVTARGILQYRTFWYDEPTGTWRVGFTVPYDSELTTTTARRGAGAGDVQSGWVLTPPDSPPFLAGANPLSALRLGFSTPGFAGPYYIVYNSQGQAISPATGQTVPNATRHYPLDAINTLLQRKK